MIVYMFPPTIVVTDCMRKVLSLPKKAVLIEQFRMLPCNAFVICDDNTGYFSQGLYYKVLKHISECQNCRRVQEEINSPEYVSQLLGELREIELMWKSISEDTD